MTLIVLILGGPDGLAAQSTRSAAPPSHAGEWLRGATPFYRMVSLGGVGLSAFPRKGRSLLRQHPGAGPWRQIIDRECNLVVRIGS